MSHSVSACVLLFSFLIIAVLGLFSEIPLKKTHPGRIQYSARMGHGVSILNHKRQVFWLTRTTLAFPSLFKEQ
jgi:hypothetical protein